VAVGEASLTRQRPQAVLALEGELDVAKAADAQKRMLRLDLRRGAQLVLDLSELTFMDSTGIRVILQAEQYARMHGAELVILRPPDDVMRVLELVGLDEQLDFVDGDRRGLVSTQGSDPFVDSGDSRRSAGRAPRNSRSARLAVGAGASR
jgi:anti-sigma B factor antagonist